jgi:hypothetical protein
MRRAETRFTKCLLFCAAVSFFFGGCSIKVVPAAAPQVYFAKQLDTATERFDPLPYSEDLLLIQPNFPRPHAELAADPPAIGAATKQPLNPDNGPAARVGDARIIYRVQVIALRDSVSASNLVAQLRQYVSAGVEMVLKNRLFMVLAGHFDNKDEALALKSTIKALGGDFSEAYVITVVEIPDMTRIPEVYKDPAPIAADLEPLFDSELPAYEAPIAESDFVDEYEEPDQPELVRVSGWRVRIMQSRDYHTAELFRNAARLKLRRNDIEIKLKNPYNRVLVGNYRTESEAQQAAESFKRKGYNNAFQVRDMVDLPRDRSR